MSAQLADIPFSSMESGAALLLKTAERLFAEHGLEAVSTRMIAREAGQKNPSALQYHFGNRDGLIEAILNYRLTPINQERLRRLDALQHRGDVVTVKRLTEVFVEPFAEELLKPVEDTSYVSLLAQLYAYQPGRDLFQKNRERNRAMFELTSLMIKALKPLPLAVIHFRLQLMGRQSMTAIAEWDEARRNQSIDLDAKSLRWRTDNLIDFIVGGLQAQVSSRY
jgi:AcrR family transcriptional regulator